MKKMIFLTLTLLVWLNAQAINLALSNDSKNNLNAEISSEKDPKTVLILRSGQFFIYPLKGTNISVTLEDKAS